ncbi:MULTISPECIES: MFS transporter [Mycobacterium]|uniref:MFS transporter n=1 Tax=Mycobacterium gordonae TaxID=1778 RepID=A0A1A6BGD6_MYCGO|nr:MULTISPECIES: MFS transporter [Mycobacterium]MCQ4365826.1 MFS transporter [Mycobacterium gordonae]MCV7006559.1 MFS transporter [Mycobacterium gordonae]OBS01420.1 MFS transporter [Mycobacterium gordonae]ODR15807.1 MFS transporter [Mycobacterium gordonae]ORV88973.1 MFS transporter [Mycobacterium gordonae]
MTAESGTIAATARTWTPRIAVQLAVLAAAAFIYVTAELLPVGALSAIARNLDVSVVLVGTLLSWYAFVAALTTVPLVRWTAHWPRRRTLLLSLVCLTISQLISALAPSFAVLAAGRVLCAVTHGLLWSVIAPIATRLVPPSHAGRATMSIYVGTSLALVVGSPLTAALSLMWGWRLAAVCVTVAAAVVTVAARVVLPTMTLTTDQLQYVGRRSTHHRNRALIIVSLITMVGVTGHFVSYTYIVVIVRQVVGVHGPNVAWLLAAYGIAGVLSVALVARPLDRRPKGAIIVCMAGLTAALALLSALAFGWHRSGVAALVVGTGAIVLWGAMATAVSPMLQSAAMRAGADDPDGASGLYVTAFQVGIMAGSLAGGLLYERSVAMMLTASAGLMGAALLAMAAIRPIVDTADSAISQAD